MSKRYLMKYMITCEPYRPEPRGSLLYGPDGKASHLSHAAEFSSPAEAEKFAETHGIKLDGAARYLMLSPRKQAE
jgi:hypothetical protein